MSSFFQYFSVRVNELFVRIFMCLILMQISATANAQFVGTLDLKPMNCEATGKCVLTFDLKYIDPSGIEWMASALNKTDGASIPAWAQPIVGKPFDVTFIRAAVIHDHYCDRHVRPWRQTHRVFYDALRESGVPEWKAKAMYYAVYVGGPKWVTLVAGHPCGGPTCINTVGFGDSVLKIQSADYGTPKLTADLAELKYLLEQNAQAFTLEELERRAQQRNPDSFFYSRGDIVQVKELLLTE
jgi:hypothetical protein